MAERLTPAAWLNTTTGINWSRTHHRCDVLSYHFMVEFRDDLTDDNIADHMWISNPAMFAYCREEEGWENLTWSPDVPPEGGSVTTWQKNA